VLFEVVVITAGQGGFETYTRLDELTSRVVAVVETDRHTELLPGLTRVRRGRIEAKYPEEMHILEGSCSYLET
jgi:NADH dehydrogenase FAD-containing subunit